MDYITLQVNFNKLRAFSAFAEIQYNIAIHNNEDPSAVMFPFEVRPIDKRYPEEFLQDLWQVFNQEYFRDCDDSLVFELPNIFFLAYEAYQEIWKNEIERKASSQALDSLKVLLEVVKLKSAKEGTVTVQFNNILNSENHASFKLSEINKTLSRNMLDDVLRYFKELRLTNEVLFELIEPDEFSEEGVKNAIKRLLPTIVGGPEFQLAHYAIIIVNYLKNKVALKKSDNSKYRLAFELFHMLKLSEFLIPAKDLFGQDDLRKRKKYTASTMKKLIENHKKSNNASYNKVLQGLTFS